MECRHIQQTKKSRLERVIDLGKCCSPQNLFGSGHDCWFFMYMWIHHKRRKKKQYMKWKIPLKVFISIILWEEKESETLQYINLFGLSDFREDVKWGVWWCSVSGPTFPYPAQMERKTDRKMNKGKLIIYHHFTRTIKHCQTRRS